MAVKEHLLIILVVTIAYVINDVDAFCGKCNDKPCEIPTCCEGGQYTHDACGCCPVCARSAEKRCGGFAGTSGTCAKELKCLRSCECATLPSVTDDKKHNCIFPFTYKDTKYEACTTSHQDIGDSWCAYEVDENGVAIDGKWGECNLACPIEGDLEGAKCNETTLDTLTGICVDEAGETKLNEEKPAYAFRFDAGAEDTEPANVCKTEVEASRCRCATSVSGEPVGQKAGCTQTTNAVEGSEPAYGWCFLENIEDPTDATKNCFPDALWSFTHGRFWSHRACVPDDVKEPEPIGKNTEEDTTTPATPAE